MCHLSYSCIGNEISYCLKFPTWTGSSKLTSITVSLLYFLIVIDTRVNESKEPQKTDYERRRDAQIAENAKVFEALGLLNLSTEFNNSVPEPATKKGKKSANQKTNSEDSDSSEFLLEDNDQGDSDDDDTESDEQPQPTKVLLLSSKYWLGKICIALDCF